MTPTAGGPGQTTDGEQHFSAINTRQLVAYTRHVLGDAGVAALLAEAGEPRSPEALVKPETWSSYRQFRNLLEAAARVLGSREALARAGAYADLSTAVLAYAVVQLGSIEALLEHLDEVNATMSQLTVVAAEPTGHLRWLVTMRMVPGYEPFEECCAFYRGVLSITSKVFGFQQAEAVEVECCCTGAAACRFGLQLRDDPERDARYWRIRAQAAELNSRYLDRTVHDLVRGVDLDRLLSRATASAAAAVGATGVVLDLESVPAAPQPRYSHGMAPHAIEALADEAKTWRAGDGGGDLPGRRPASVSVAVASNRAHFGHLTAVRRSGAFLPQQRFTLETYARSIAVAVGSATAVHELRESATEAEALLDLARALADVSTSVEMADRIVRAMPAVLGCDRAVVTLVDPERGTERFVATHGLAPEVAEALLELELPVPPPGPVPVQHIDPDDPELGESARAALAITKSAGSVVVPIMVDDRLAGRIVASVTHDPARLRSPRIESRLAGLAAQASTAIRNATLLDRVRHQALHDPLTGLANRALILDRLEHLVARARRSDQAPAILFIDLDGFKEVNDAFGHGAGDALIRQAAARIAANARSSDTVGRLGGDEFVVLLESAFVPDGVERVAERLLAALNEPYDLAPVADRSTTVSASIGISFGDRSSPAELLRDADIALYRAKEEGKARYSVFAPEARDAVDRNIALRAALFGALEAGQFFLVYQPIVDLAAARVVGAEALLRWRHPERGVLTPDRFIAALEDIGLIAEVGRWVLRHACDEAAGWDAGGDALSVAVNVSPLQVTSLQLVGDVRDALSSSGLAAGRLTIEVTESVLLRDTRSAVRCLGALRHLGVRVAIDDFGTGYSSLAYLRELPADQLKIDRAFIATLEEDGQRGTALLRAMIQLGKSLGLRTVAEGVERAIEHQTLRTEECDAGQGYLFAPPLEAGEFSRRYVQDQGARATDG